MIAVITRLCRKYTFVAYKECIHLSLVLAEHCVGVGGGRRLVSDDKGTKSLYCSRTSLYCGKHDNEHFCFLVLLSSPSPPPPFPPSPALPYCAALQEEEAANSREDCMVRREGGRLYGEEGGGRLYGKEGGGGTVW